MSQKLPINRLFNGKPIPAAVQTGTYPFSVVDCQPRAKAMTKTMAIG